VSRASLVLGLFLFLSALLGGIGYALLVVSDSGEVVAVLDADDASPPPLALDLSPEMNPLRATLDVSFSTRLAMLGSPLRMTARLDGPSGATLWTEDRRLQEIGESGVGRTRISLPVQRFDVSEAGRHRLTLAFHDGRGARVDEAHLTVRRNVTVMSWPLVGAFVGVGAVGILLLLLAAAIDAVRR